MPGESATTDCWGRSLHQTAPLMDMDWCESLLTHAGINLAAVEACPDARLARQVSRVLSADHRQLRAPLATESGAVFLIHP